MTPVRRTTVFATLICMAVVPAACGGDATSSGATTTASPPSSPSAGAFRVDDSKCPADAKQPLAPGADIKLGITLPQSGDLAAFGAVAVGAKVYVEKVNAEGGVDGHKVTLTAKDDAYDPKLTLPRETELIEQDKVFGTLGQVGTPNVAASRALHEQTCTPQLWVGSGFPAWGDPDHHQWTVGGLLAYNTEADTWADYIAANKPGAKVAQLVFDNDFGKSYQSEFERKAKEKGLDVVETKLHSGRATSIDNEITAILAADPDYVLGETTGAFCSKLMAGLSQGGYKGVTIVSSGCGSVRSFFKPIDPAGNGVLLLGQQKDPSDPVNANDPAIVQYKADVTKFGAGGDAKDGNVLTGYNFAVLAVANLRAAAQLPGGLTRVNLMNAAWNTDTRRDTLLGGRSKVNGNDDAYVVEYTALLRYDAAAKSQVKTGDVFDNEGKTGLFGGG
jgi:branched-chain amino acid transport system substrate-binding protein